MPLDNKTPHDLRIPLVCPHCGWIGTVEGDDVKLSWDRYPDGVRKDNDIKWTCPSCEMVVHGEDE